jgi:hypothetical protein
MANSKITKYSKITTYLHFIRFYIRQIYSLCQRTIKSINLLITIFQTSNKPIHSIHTIPSFFIIIQYRFQSSLFTYNSNLSFPNKSKYPPLYFYLPCMSSCTQYYILYHHIRHCFIYDIFLTRQFNVCRSYRSCRDRVSSETSACNVSWGCFGGVTKFNCGLHFHILFCVFDKVSSGGRVVTNLFGEIFGNAL